MTTQAREEQHNPVLPKLKAFFKGHTTKNAFDLEQFFSIMFHVLVNQYFLSPIKFFLLEMQNNEHQNFLPRGSNSVVLWSPFSLVTDISCRLQLQRFPIFYTLNISSLVEGVCILVWHWSKLVLHVQLNSIWFPIILMGQYNSWLENLNRV